MKIHGLAVCVGYSDLLSLSIERWRDGLDSLGVVTSLDDRATLKLCAAADVVVHATDAFTRDGAAFNKSAAMDEEIHFIDQRIVESGDDRAEHWILFFDADIIPAASWRTAVEWHRPMAGNLYGAKRQDEKGQLINDRELAGFFQFFNAADVAAADRPLLGSWHNASGYDSMFMRRWPHAKRLILPLVMNHLGEPGQNWCGRRNTVGMLQMQQERSRRGGWQHERLS